MSTLHAQGLSLDEAPGLSTSLLSADSGAPADQVANLVMEVMGGYITVRDVSKPKGESYRVEVDRASDLAQLKSAISKATGFAVDDLRLTFNGHTLEHELQGNKLIHEIGINDGSTVHMLLHPKAQKQAIIAAAFRAFVRRTPQRPPRFACPGARAPCAQANEPRLRPRQDKDGSGFLEHDEIRAILMRPGGGAPLAQDRADEEVREFIKKYDENGDGKLSISEIAGYLAQRFWDDVEAKAA